MIESRRRVDSKAARLRSSIGSEFSNVAAIAVCLGEFDARVDSLEAATSVHEGRLQRALVAGDFEQAVGSAKEMCESVALAVVALVRGESANRNWKYPRLIATAHAVLARDPRNCPRGSVLQTITEKGRAAAVELGELRNEWGTGHGRTTPAHVPDDIALLAVELSQAWCTWALRRLHAGLGVELDWTSTGMDADLDSILGGTPMGDLLEPAQFRLGLVVGRSNQRATFSGRHEAVRTVALSDDFARWPVPYRAGLLSGIVKTADGLLALDEMSVEIVGELIASTGDRSEIMIEALSCAVDEVLEAGVDPALLIDARRRATRAALTTQASKANENVRVVWQRLENMLLT